MQPVERAQPNDLVEQHVSLARRIATRYVGRGEPLEDLVQVAMLGLVKAAHRFDPDRGTDFPRYAVPTILGELRRHFRDSCWAVHVPRDLQELTLRVHAVADQLSHEVGRSPTVVEVADALDLSEDEVLEALAASSAYSTTSLDAPALRTDPLGPTVGDRLTSEESSLDNVEAREAVRKVLARLPARERRLLTLRFYGERTQREIAEELQLSQMHVSRLLARTITRLRDHLVHDVELPDEWRQEHQPPPFPQAAGRGTQPTCSLAEIDDFDSDPYDNSAALSGGQVRAADVEVRRSA